MSEVHGTVFGVGSGLARRRGSEPHGWNSRLPALNQSLTPRMVRSLSRLLTLLIVSFPVGLGIVPWQQNVQTKGEVSAFLPGERTQVVEAPVKGRIAEWRVTEGSRVQVGDVLVVLTDFDPEYARRLEEQRVAAEAKLAASEAKVVSYQEQGEAIQLAQDLAIKAADERIEAAINGVTEAEQEVAASEAGKATAAIIFDRQKSLADAGITAQQKIDELRLKVAETVAKVKQAQAKLQAKQRDLAAKRADRDSYLAQFKAKLSEIEAKRQEARGTAEEARQKLLEYEVKTARQSTQEVRSPSSGTVFRIADNASLGEFVKPGTKLVTVVPEPTELAVELWLDGNDMPLVRAGRHVRLQFEGWPAVQFAGWPSVAIGTFGGLVALVDATDKDGKFRVLVQPDPDEPAWPSQPYLRQGVRVKGWVLLDQVTLGYELWRQFNGFPQTVSQAVPGKDKFVKVKQK